MKRRAIRGRVIPAGILTMVLTAILTIGCAGPALAAPTVAAHAQIEGAGSSWSANAVNQWIADVNGQGLHVGYTVDGSARTTTDDGFRTADFEVRDGVPERTPGIGQSNSNPTVVLPIIAGGTSFPYQIRIDGQLVRNLRLSGATIAKIFTNQIATWDDPAITADNNGRTLPPLPVIPVVHAEGAGSVQFTSYLATQYPADWASFSGGNVAVADPFPRKGPAVARDGSVAVMDYIASVGANGAIGYDEYSYPLSAGYPVAKVRNASGYFTLPGRSNVAVALTGARIDLDPASPTYLAQGLAGVYGHDDVRAYPLSSYSYLVLPTATSADDPRMTTAKRQTLADVLHYALCAGQREMGALGYTPLPTSLVQLGLRQLQQLTTADAGVQIAKGDASTCDNPTFVAGHPQRNALVETAPDPAACDKSDAGPCPTDGAGRTGQGAAAPMADRAKPAGVQIDPDTGQVIAGRGPGAGDASGAPTPAALPASEAAGLTDLLGPLAVLELLTLVVIALLPRPWLARRRRERP